MLRLLALLAPLFVPLLSGAEEPQPLPEGLMLVPAWPEDETKDGHMAFVILPNKHQYCGCGTDGEKIVCVCKIPDVGFCVQTPI